MCAAAESEETQIRGLVLLGFLMSPLKSQTANRDKFYRLPRLMEVVPVRDVSIHVCFQDPLYRFVSAMAVFSLPPPRSRMRFHHGEWEKRPVSILLFYVKK